VLVRQGFQFAVMVVLARLLTPADFGTVALLSLFTGVATVVVDAGISTALIQRRDITRVDECTAFWANMALGGLMAAALAVASPAIADFYDRDVLQPLTMAMAVNLLLNSSSSVQVALFTKALNFRPILVAGALGSVLSSATALVLAAYDFGVWALACQVLVMSGVSAATLWVLSDWRPGWTFSWPSAHRLLGFGGYIFLANMSDVVFTRLYTVLAGRMFGIREVGFYNRAETAQQLPVDILSTVSSRVALPVFSVAQDRETLHSSTRTALRTVLFLNVPMLLGLSAIAEPTVAVVFGPQWTDVVPLLEVLCLAGAIWPMQVINVQVLLAQGHGRLSLILEVVKKSVGVVFLTTGAIFFGLAGLAWGQVAFSAFAVVANTHFTGKFLGYGLVAQVRDLLPILAVSTPAAVAARAVVDSWDAPPIQQVVAGVFVGAAVFFALAFGFRIEALHELIGRGAHEQSEAVP
jgi:O-antigen/teichoic acid export membrane protein